MLNLSFLSFSAFAGALLSFSTVMSPTTSPTEPTTPAAPTGVKNIVFVHGAWADGSCWAKVIPLLEAKGYNIISVQNPLTSLADDVAATKRAIALQNGPVLLVGHSWGGAVITEAGNDPKVAGLLYVAASAPDSDTSFGETAQLAPPPLATKPVAPDAAGFLSLTRQGAVEDFAQDLPMAERLLIYITQGPTAASAFGDKISTAAWKTKPSWYIVATEDRMINPDLERLLAKRMKATTIELKGSHVVMLSQPAKVATFISEAAEKVAVK